MNRRTAALAARSVHLAADELLAATLEVFGDRVALASSFSAEDQVIVHMLTKLTSRPSVFTLDTGRLHEQTYAIMETTRRRYGVEIELLCPDASELGEMLRQHGPNLFYESPELRRLCCNIRKVHPLQRKLSTLDAWITGLRTAQSSTRQTINRVEWDSVHGIAKINPVADWGTQQLWEYIRVNRIPYNPLHDQGYPSIGCEPCTRAAKDGQDIRAGRWWWENPEHRECGIHLNGPGNRSKETSK